MHDKTDKQLLFLSNRVQTIYLTLKKTNVMGKSVINLKVYFYNFIIFILYVIYNKVLLKYLYQKFLFSS